MKILDSLPPDALEVANYIIDYERLSHRTITVHKLIHVLYMAQGYTLAYDNKPLFYDNVLTSENFSIIIPSVFKAFVMYGPKDAIENPYCYGDELVNYTLLKDFVKDCYSLDEPRDRYPRISHLSERHKKIIDKVCDCLGKMDSIETANCNIHSCHASYKAYVSSIPQIIPIEAIKNEFNKRIKS